MIKGLQKISLIDYPGKIACTIFIGGCNFRCGYCYNSDLVFNNKSIPNISEDKVVAFLSSRKKYLEGVCITGGEPTLYKDLIPLIKKIKNLGYKVKLDTNGSNPIIIKRLLQEELIDYIAMDIKAPLESYELVASVRVNEEKIKETINIIKNSGIEYEFRTTIVPDIITEDKIHKICSGIKGAKRYFIQQFKADIKTIDSKYNKMVPLEKDKLENFMEVAKQYVEFVGIRGI